MTEKYPTDKYKWKGLKPRVQLWFFRWKPMYIRGANFRELNWLFWKFTISYPYNPMAIWQDGWDACFRDSLPEKEIIDSLNVKNRAN